jgi:hypothetical protein
VAEVFPQVICQKKKNGELTVLSLIPILEVVPTTGVQLMRPVDIISRNRNIAQTEMLSSG